MPDTMLDHALALANEGLIVFPVHYPLRTHPNAVCSCSKGANCKHIGKHPATPHGHYDASSDPTAIKRLWQQNRNYNIGLPTGRLNSFDVLDEDLHHNGNLSLQRLIDIHGPLPPTARTKTGGGGHHYLYLHTPGTSNDNSGKIGEGLDYKTEGGFIVAPPSLHASGHTYSWEAPGPIAPAPDWLITLIKEESTPNQSSYRRPRRKPEYWCNLARGSIAEGRRSDAVTSITGLLLDMRGLDPRLAIRLIHGFNIECCNPPLARDEVADIIKSITRKITS